MSISASIRNTARKTTSTNSPVNQSQRLGRFCPSRPFFLCAASPPSLSLQPRRRQPYLSFSKPARFFPSFHEAVPLQPACRQPYRGAYSAFPSPRASRSFSMKPSPSAKLPTSRASPICGKNAGGRKSSRVFLGGKHPMPYGFVAFIASLASSSVMGWHRPQRFFLSTCSA